MITRFSSSSFEMKGFSLSFAIIWIMTYSMYIYFIQCMGFDYSHHHYLSVANPIHFNICHAMILLPSSNSQLWQSNDCHTSNLLRSSVLMINYYRLSNSWFEQTTYNPYVRSFIHVFVRWECNTAFHRKSKRRRKEREDYVQIISLISPNSLPSLQSEFLTRTM